jgi:hypothetical protein
MEAIAFNNWQSVRGAKTLQIQTVTTRMNAPILYKDHSPYLYSRHKTVLENDLYFTSLMVGPLLFCESTQIAATCLILGEGFSLYFF